ncbi:POU domain, class 6, transcription factor 2-like [Artemia franciscana]|uniref:POU domain protein n=1 Tax=Artemia franciscana TaxID=6661 RepID=A0AA88KXQ4_ARTSF|nr:hypothetical protein QYM36_016198 [Artemia franciscana]
MYLQQENLQNPHHQLQQQQQWTGVSQNMGASMQSEQRVPPVFTSQSIAHLQNMQVPNNINSPYEVFQQNSVNYQPQFQQGQQVFQTSENVFVQPYNCAEMKSDHYNYAAFQGKNQNDFVVQQQNMQQQNLLYNQYENQFQHCSEQQQEYQQRVEQNPNQYQFLISSEASPFSQRNPTQNIQLPSECVQNSSSVVQLHHESLRPEPNANVPSLQNNIQRQNLQPQCRSLVQQEMPGHAQNVTQTINQESSSNHLLPAQQQQCHQTQQIMHQQQILTCNQQSVSNPPLPNILQSGCPQQVLGTNGAQIVTNTGQQIVTPGQTQLISNPGIPTHMVSLPANNTQPQLITNNIPQQVLASGIPTQHIIPNQGQQHLIAATNSQPQQLVQAQQQPQGTILIPMQQTGQSQLPQMISMGNGQFLIIQPNAITPQIMVPIPPSQPSLHSTQLLIQTPQGLVVQPIFTLPQQHQVIAFPHKSASPSQNNASQSMVKIIQPSLQAANQDQSVSQPAQPHFVPPQNVPQELVEDSATVDSEAKELDDDGSPKPDVVFGDKEEDGEEKKNFDKSTNDEEIEEEKDLEEEENMKEDQPVQSQPQPFSLQMVQRPGNGLPQPIFINGGTILSGNSDVQLSGQMLPLAQTDGNTQPFMVVAPNPAVQQVMMAPPPSQSPDSTEDLGQPTINQTNAHIVDGVDLEEIKEFAKAFKMRRMSLGLTQTQVGQALSAAAGPAYSQSAICRFERLDITPKSAQKIRPVLEKWMKEAEEKFLKGRRDLVEFVRLPGLNKIRKRRTSFSPEAVALLSQYFEINKQPTGSEVTSLAHQLGYEREVIRIWFCNKRQAMRNSSKCLGRKKGKQITIPEKPNVSSTEASMETSESPQSVHDDGDNSLADPLEIDPLEHHEAETVLN